VFDLGPIANRADDRINRRLKRRGIRILQSKDRIPQRSAQEQPQPPVRSVSSLCHQRYHQLLLLVCVVRFQPTAVNTSNLSEKDLDATSSG
jgi:hypothetical protein